MSAGMDQHQVAGWLADIVAWENDSSLLNPFQSRSTSNKFFLPLQFTNFKLILLDLSQADVQLKLAQQDAFDLQRVGMSVATEGPSAMIYEGLELEESR